MLDRMINYSLNNKLIVFLFTLGLVGYGLFALTNISIGAVPDITNNQVQVITTSRNLSTEDVERFLTAPVELEMANLPGVREIRSTSKFGLSVVTVVFEDDMGTYLPRQLIAEKIRSAEEKIPQGFGSPTMGPVTTGLGEIYQYILDVRPGYEERYSVTDLRTVQDWIVKRQLSGIPGVVEVNTWGGFLKTYEVAVDPEQLRSLDISISEVFSAMEENNSIAGGGYIEKANEAYFIRAEGLTSSLKDIEDIVLTNRSGVPIYIGDVAEVGYGHATRFGAITGNGEGEKVLGQVMMLKGASSKKVIDAVNERVAVIQSTLPEGVFINPILERSELIGRTTFTIAENLILGCLIVVFVVVVLLGNIRSGLVVASVIPLCLLFAISLMHIVGVDANLMSLGAIDFGIIIDGAVIIVEYVAFKIARQSRELSLVSGAERRSLIDSVTFAGTSKMMRSAVFGQLIIVIVFIPILSLTDIEGKMFRPMALTFCFALIGAMILCFTYVPVMSALFIRPPASDRRNMAHRMMGKLEEVYAKVLRGALHLKYLVILFALGLFALTGYLFSQMGAEFMPTLDEGDFVIQPVLKTGMSLEATVDMVTRMEIIIKRFPEVRQVVTRIGAAEVPTDPMSMEESDIIITLQPKSEWTSADSKDGLAEVFKEAIESEIPAVDIEFTQPIEMRFNELITGVRADLAIKIFGEDLDVLYKKAVQVSEAISGVAGAADITVEKIAGLPQMVVRYDRKKIAKYGLNVAYLNDVISMGFAGLASGTIFEGERQFDLVIRYDATHRQDISNLQNAMVDIPNGGQLPMSTFADITYATGPARISRDDTKRRVVVGVNVRGRDLQSVVDDVTTIINDQVEIPVGYAVEYGGQFENLQSATRRLMVAVPLSLFLIFVLLYFAFRSMKEALMIYSAIPLSAVGGVLLLYFRDMPFSISAGVGFIALFGIAVLNGIVLIEHFKELQKEGMTDINLRVVRGATERLRPVLLTATAAALGFLPMAISTSAGAEVQRPLATVVIGGLVTATILTLLVLPILYSIFENRKLNLRPHPQLLMLVIGLLMTTVVTSAQKSVTLPEAIELANKNSLAIEGSELTIEKYRSLVEAVKVVDKTRFSYGYDRSNVVENGRPLHTIGASQSLKMPAVHRAKKEEAMSKVGLAESSVEIDKHYLAKAVSEAYYTVQHVQALAAEYKYLDSLFEEVEMATNRQFELGEMGQIARLKAVATHQEIQVQLEEVLQKRDEAKLALNLLLQEDVMISDTILMALPVSSFKIGDHPIVLYLDKELEVSQKSLTTTQKEQLPEVDISVFSGLNSFGDFRLYPGIEAGIAIPLSRKAYESRQQAARIEIETKALGIEHEKRLLSNRQQRLLAELERHKKAIAQYDRSGRQLQTDLIAVSQRSFDLGEIDLIMHISSLEQAAGMRIDYLDHLYQYNLTAVAINYLLN